MGNMPIVLLFTVSIIMLNAQMPDGFIPGFREFTAGYREFINSLPQLVLNKLQHQSELLFIK